jgi:hypothetical protein
MPVEQLSARPAAGRPEAAAAVWDWRRNGESAAGDGPSRLRRRALVEAAVAAAAGGLLFFWKPPLAWVAWTIGAATLLAALLSPEGLYAGIRRGVAWFGHAVGQVLTVVLLVPLFFGFFAVFGALFRRGRRNRMEPRFDRAAPSYWKRRDARERTLADYERLS